MHNLRPVAQRRSPSGRSPLPLGAYTPSARRHERAGKCRRRLCGGGARAGDGFCVVGVLFDQAAPPFVPAELIGDGLAAR
jgi:hypothetical protein